jgi:ATP-dependent Lon protease
VGYVFRGPDQLYSLWEEQSAASFTDISVPLLKVNSSRIIWLATANRLEGIPEPILSRMLPLYVPPLSRLHSLRLVQKLYVEVGLEISHAVNMAPLAEALAEKLAAESPRAIKRLLRLAIGSALYDGRREIVADDLAMAGRAVEATDNAQQSVSASARMASRS